MDVDSRSELFAEAVRLQLQAARPPLYHFKPDRVEREIEFRDQWVRDSDFRLLYWLLPGLERYDERPSRQLGVESEVTVLGMFRYPHADEDPFVPPQPVIDATTFTNGARTVTGQPPWPAHLTVLIGDEDLDLSAGTITIEGLDPEGNAISNVFDLVAGGRAVTLSGVFASVSAVTVAGVTGGDGDESLRILAGPARAEVQDWIAADIVRAVDEPGIGSRVTRLQAVELFDIDRDIQFAEWVLVKVDLYGKFSTDRNAP